jgi:hypothetical protein
MAAQYRSESSAVDTEYRLEWYGSEECFETYPDETSMVVYKSASGHTWNAGLQRWDGTTALAW